MSKLTFLACLSVFILSGCGGSSGSSSPEGGDPEVENPATEEPEVEEPEVEEPEVEEPEVEEPAPEPEPEPENTAPAANAGTAGAVQGGTVVRLDGSGSSDEDGDALNYHWSIDSAATAYFVAEGGSLTDSLESATGKLFIPASQTGQDIEVHLNVSDGDETASDSVTYSVANCVHRKGYVFTDCVDPAWEGPMAWDVNFLEVTENFGYFGGSTDNHVRWSLVDAEKTGRGRVLDVSFNKENWRGSFRFVPAGHVEGGSSVDLSAYENGYLVFDLRVVEPMDVEIFIEAECIYPCRSVPRPLASATDGNWSTVSVPLSEYTDMDWSKASVPFMIYPDWEAQTGVRIQLDNIRFEGASCAEEPNVVFGECLGPNWYTMAAVDDDTAEYLSGNTSNHIQWRKTFSGNPTYGDILEVNFTGEASNGHFYVRTESRETANDMSEYLNGALVFEMNVQDYGAAENIVVRVDTWWDGETSNDILLPEVATGEWTTVEIPVSDLLVGGGLDLSNVLAGFSLWPAGDQPGDQKGFKVLLDNIRWETQLSE